MSKPRCRSKTAVGRRRANAGYRAVSAMPSLDRWAPSPRSLLMKGVDPKKVTEKLD